MTADPFYAAQLADTEQRDDVWNATLASELDDTLDVPRVKAAAREKAAIRAEIKLNTAQFRRIRAACQWSARNIGDLDVYAARVSLAIRKRKNINGGGRRKDASRRSAAPAREDVT